MRTKIFHSSYVIDFLDNGFDSTKVGLEIEELISRTLPQDHTEQLKDWSIEFNVIYNNCDQIYIFRKSRSNTSTKCKGVTIHIPIPLNNEVHWGVNSDQRIQDYSEKFKKLKLEGLEINYLEFSNRSTYILNCLKKAITMTFNLGITIGGFKIKYEEFKL